MIKKYLHSRNIFAILVAVMIFVNCLTPMADAATATAHRGSPSSGMVCRVTTTAIASAIKPFYGTQAVHNPAVASTTTIGVSSTSTTSVSASASITQTVGASYFGVSYEAACEVGVSASASHSIGQSVSYTLDSSDTAGKYRIITVFPQYKTNFYIYKYTLTSTTFVLNKTISKMPEAYGGYHDIQRYAGL